MDCGAAARGVDADGAGDCVGAGAPSRIIPGGALCGLLPKPKEEGQPIGGYLGTSGAGIFGVWIV